MEGYLKSKSNFWKHVFKKQIRPGGKIALDDLYDIYGKKHSLKQGDDFINWLKEVKLKSTIDQWEIILQDDVVPEDLSAEVDVNVSSNTAVEKEPIKASINDKSVEQKDVEKVVTDEDAEKAIRNYNVEDIVQLSVRKVRDIITEISDIKLLKYALQEAKPRPNKESLCRILEKRISELEIISR